MTDMAAHEPVPFLDLKASHKPLRDEILAAVAQVIDSCVFRLGENVKQFEKEFADFCHSPHAVTVGSGTDALVLSLEVLGVGRDDEVIVPTWSFAASAAAVYHVGAKPVFVDCAPDSYLVDVCQIESRITPRTKAIMPVHLYGEMADAEAVKQIAEKNSLAVVEDTAQAAGAKHNGKAAGAIGDAGCFSFYPTKTLGSCGEGGLVLTPREDIDKKIRHLRNQADDTIIGGRQYSHSTAGYNSRLQEIQAAILRIKLRYLAEWNARRQELARMYSEQLADAPVALPAQYPDDRHIYSVYTIRTPHRDELVSWLKENGIGNLVYYPIPLHLQPAYASLGYKAGDFPVAERHAREVVSLPMFPELTEAQVSRVCAVVKTFF